MSTRVLVADDHGLVREALIKLIESHGMTVVAEAADGLEAVEMAQKHRPDVAVLDLWMPRLSGIPATRQIVRDQSAGGVVVLTMHEGWSHVRDALGAGASGYVVKSAASSQLIDAIHAVRAGKAYVSSAVAHHVVDSLSSGGNSRGPVATLTDRELQVLQLIAEGLTSKEIAVQLGFAPKTADAHRASLMSKLDIHKTSGLVRFAIREGIIAP